MRLITEKIKSNFNTIIEYFLLFIIYSHLGWWMEVLIFYCKTHTFINRGFLMGPYCSIYGFGCLFITICFKKYRNNVPKLFVISFIWSAIVEYIISYVIEIIFGGRWWQYTDANMGNINGRVWVGTTLLFAVLATILIKWIEPLILKLLHKIKKKFVNPIGLIIAIVYLVDIIITSTFVIGFRDEITNISNDCTTIVSDYVWSEVKNIFK